MPVHDVLVGTSLAYGREINEPDQDEVVPSVTQAASKDESRPGRLLAERRPLGRALVFQNLASEDPPMGGGIDSPPPALRLDNVYVGGPT